MGRLFREFAVTLAVTIVLSAGVADSDSDDGVSYLKHNAEAQQGRFYKWSEHIFESMIAFYGRTLKFVLGFQGITLLIAVANAGADHLPLSRYSQGVFPVQDTGVIQGISQAPQTIGSKGMAASQQELAKVILADPAVESLSSFVGADGTNTTLNSGRISINLKPA